MIKQGKKGFLSLLVLLLLVVFHYTKILSPVERLFFVATKPFSGRFYYFSGQFRKYYNFGWSNGNYCNTNDRNLKDENEKLIIENSKLKSLEDENENLRKHLSFLNKSNYRYSMANVVSRAGNDNGGDNQYLVIDRGSRDGIKDGLAVVDGDGVLVGKIIEVKDNISKVCMTTDKNCKLAVALQNSSKTFGVSSGDLGLTIKINFIPQNENVASGDVVVTSGLEKDVPRGLIVGKVSQVDKSSNEIWQNVTVDPMASFDNLVIVSVLLP